MDIKEIGINTRNWVDSIQDRDYWTALVNATLNLRISKAMGVVSSPSIQRKKEIHISRKSKLKFRN